MYFIDQHWTYGQQHYNSYLKDIYLPHTYSLHKAHDNLQLRRLIHLTTILGDHFEKKTHQQKSKQLISLLLATKHTYIRYKNWRENIKYWFVHCQLVILMVKDASVPRIVHLCVHGKAATAKMVLIFQLQIALNKWAGLQIQKL